MNAKSMSRLVRQAFPGRNGLADAGDRWEGAVLVVTLIVALLAVPIAAATGSEIYATQRDQAAGEHQSKHQVNAALIGETPPASSPGQRGGAAAPTPVPATWQLPDGSARQGLVDAHHDSAAGTTVRIWIDESGGVTEPPMTTEGAAVTAAVSAFVLWCAITGAMALLYLTVRLAHSRTRLRRWTNEWKRIAPEWTGR